jgi:hypothetical protein
VELSGRIHHSAGVSPRGTRVGRRCNGCTSLIGMADGYPSPLRVTTGLLGAPQQELEVHEVVNDDLGVRSRGGKEKEERERN